MTLGKAGNSPTRALLRQAGKDCCRGFGQHFCVEREGLRRFLTLLCSWCGEYCLDARSLLGSPFSDALLNALGDTILLRGRSLALNSGGVRVLMDVVFV